MRRWSTVRWPSAADILHPDLFAAFVPGPGRSQQCGERSGQATGAVFLAVHRPGREVRGVCWCSKSVDFLLSPIWLCCYAQLPAALHAAAAAVAATAVCCRH